MSRRKPSVIAVTVAVMRRQAHERRVAELREGRRQRAIAVPSGKTYKRREKHVHNNKETYA